MKQAKSKQRIIATTVRVPQEFWDRVRIQAIHEGVGTGELIIRVMTDYLKKGASR
jgi:hypothetical protein